MVTLVRNELPLLFNSTVDEIGCAICGHIDVLRECVCVCMCVCVGETLELWYRYVSYVTIGLVYLQCF